MKKYLLYSALFFFLTGVIFTQTITVTNPSQGAVWNKGTKYNITWTTTGNVYQSVKIRLFNSSATVKELDIDDSIPTTDGSVEWTIPGTVNPGSYVVIVRTSNNSTTGISKVFTIAGVPEVEPSITFSKPDSDTIWRKGIIYSITWTKVGLQSSGVNIGIYKNSISQANLVGQLAGPNNESKSWSIPNNYASGTYYLRIKTDDNKITADSEAFKIKPKFQIAPEMLPTPIHGEIEIIKPSISSFWKEGKSHLIKWKNKFTKKNTIKIDLYNYSGNTFIKTIKTILGVNVIKINKGGGKPSDTSTCNWYIPKGTGPGKFIIKISRTDGKASGKSEMFTVKIGTKVKIYEINGSIGNYCKRSFWAVDTGNLAHLKSQVGNCVGKVGDTQGWVGYWNYMPPHGKSYHGDIWRTYIYFDLKPFIGKGAILKAKLKYYKVNYPGSSNCTVSVYRLLAPLGDAFNINGEFVDTPKSNMTSIAWSWMGFPGSNYGIMLVGADESFKHDQSKCRASLRGIKLEIEFLEKE